MTITARLLHITDTHLKTSGTELKRDDHKQSIPGITQTTREEALSDTLKRVSAILKGTGQHLEGIVFCGDAQVGGKPGGHKLLFELLMENFGSLGITPQKIVAVPGNHDVPRGSAPNSESRYQAFTDVWRNYGCITPWLDGVDTGVFDWTRHVLVAENKEWAVIAINSCNWSHVSALPEELRNIWDDIPAKFGNGDAELEKMLRLQLDSLARYDMARVSPEQLEALKEILRDVPKPKNIAQVRIAALHHHLRAPSHREEVKPFADVTNLEQVRTFLQEENFSVLLHGHKHETKVQHDYIHVNGNKTPHRVLMVAGATFSAGHENDAVRVIALEGLPRAPSLNLTAYPLARKGLETQPEKSADYRLWEAQEPLNDPPVIVQGTDFDDVYARVLVVANGEARQKTLVVHLDVTDSTTIARLPRGYPISFADDKQSAAWLNDLVSWWQMPSSQMDQRMRYIHGNRLRRYTGDVDQISRIGNLLRKGPTTRAIAVLIDPARDFRDEQSPRDFSSFCMVQFIRRDGPGSEKHVDCMAFYRAQEMIQWWPINVAELLHLQTEIGSYFGGKPGRITTITPNARSTARSPTHVAMPVIDRWLDQAPQKLYALAASLARGALVSDLEKSISEEWLSALKDLKTAASNPDADGGAVAAIEGLNTLAKYLETSPGPKYKECASLAGALKNLASLGGDQRRHGHPIEIKAWGKSVADLLDSVDGQCRQIWSCPASHVATTDISAS